MTKLFIVEISVVILLLVSLLFSIGWRWKSNPDRWAFLKDLLIPLVTPMVVVLLGFWFAQQQAQQQAVEAQKQSRQQALDAQIQAKQQALDAAIQQQANVMKQVMFSQERRDTSFLIAVDTQLTVHLLRYASLENNPSKNFDEEAIFFFYGLHRAKLVNLQATRGSLAFPRLWMESAFQELADNVVTNIVGNDVLDENAVPQGEAVIYKYFGLAGGDAKQPGTTPLLMDFHALLAASTNSVLTDEETGILKAEFSRFHQRLQANDINMDDLVGDLFAMIGLVNYAYNNLFADWYQLQKHPGDDIPKTPPLSPGCPPEQFALGLESLADNEADSITNAWNRICILVNQQHRGKP